MRGNRPPSEEERAAHYAAYQERFRKARSDPGLIEGRVLQVSEVDCKMGRVMDRAQRYALIMRALSPDGGHFMFYVGDNMIVGDVEALWTMDERLFVLSDVRVAHGKVEDIPLQVIADHTATLQDRCTAGKKGHIPTFILLEGGLKERGR